MNANADRVVVIKMNTDRKETWRYQGHIINRSPHSLLIEAFFNIDSISFHGITLQRNDRWYNIFEIHDRRDDRLKAWYCNVTRPAEFSPGKVTYVDLALDVLVYPDGEYLVLDENEFQELTLEPKTRDKAREGLRELITLAQSGGIGDALK